MQGALVVHKTQLDADVQGRMIAVVNFGVSLDSSASDSSTVPWADAPLPCDRIPMSVLETRMYRSITPLVLAGMLLPYTTATVKVMCEMVYVNVVFSSTSAIQCSSFCNNGDPFCDGGNEPEFTLQCVVSLAYIDTLRHRSEYFCTPCIR